MKLKENHVYPVRCLYLLLMVSGCLAAKDVEKNQGPAMVEASIMQQQAALSSGRITSLELTRIYLARIAQYDERGPALNAISSVNSRAEDIATKLDEERVAKGARGPLHGIPLIVKDNFETLEMPLTAGSTLFSNWYPAHDAFVVQRLREAGAIILATANMHEFAMGVETSASLHGQTLSPYAPDRIPGGSSGGTGVAVAVGFASAGLGTDTCGSVRIPAAFNSLVGLRASQGLISRSGILPLAPTQDIVGPLARSVADVAVILGAIAGYDPADPQTSLGVGHVPPAYTDFLQPDGLSGARVGLLISLLRVEAEDEEVALLIDQAAVAMRVQGADVIEIDIPGLEELKGNYLSRMEFRFALQEYLSDHPTTPVNSIEEIIASEKYHPDMAARLKAAQAAESLTEIGYLQQLARRAQLKELILNAMAVHELDVIVYPTMRRKAAKIGERQTGNNCYLSSRSGLPSITVPAGFTSDHLPVGVEFLGRAWSESLLLKLAYSYEQATRHRRSPGLTSVE
jgi:amidase